MSVSVSPNLVILEDQSQSNLKVYRVHKRPPFLPIFNRHCLQTQNRHETKAVTIDQNGFSNRKSNNGDGNARVNYINNTQIECTQELSVSSSSSTSNHQQSKVWDNLTANDRANSDHERCKAGRTGDNISHSRPNLEVLEKSPHSRLPPPKQRTHMERRAKIINEHYEERNLYEEHYEEEYEEELHQEHEREQREHFKRKAMNNVSKTEKINSREGDELLLVSLPPPPQPSSLQEEEEEFLLSSSLLELCEAPLSTTLCLLDNTKHVQRYSSHAHSASNVLHRKPSFSIIDKECTCTHPTAQSETNYPNYREDKAEEIALQRTNKASNMLNVPIVTKTNNEVLLSSSTSTQKHTTSEEQCNRSERLNQKQVRSSSRTLESSATIPLSSLSSSSLSLTARVTTKTPTAATQSKYEHWYDRKDDEEYFMLKRSLTRFVFPDAKMRAAVEAKERKEKLKVANKDHSFTESQQQQQEEEEYEEEEYTDLINKEALESVNDYKENVNTMHHSKEQRMTNEKAQNNENQSENTNTTTEKDNVNSSKRKTAANHLSYDISCNNTNQRHTRENYTERLKNTRKTAQSNVMPLQSRYNNYINTAHKNA